ncbi:MAG: AAA family ATPase [Bacteroidota bacterium]
MKEFLNNYLKYVAATNLETGDFAGPVITISRQTGCSARRIAIKLSKILTGYSYMSETKTDAEWQWADKDAFAEAIKEVQKELTARNIDNPEMQEKLSEVAMAFSTEHFSGPVDEKTIMILKDVIVKLAIQGRFIILGRGATTILSDLPNKLSIRLEAPLEWRINRVAQIKNMSHKDAREHVMKADEKRKKFTESLIGRTYVNTDFDVIFNYASLSDDQIVDAIVNILKSKKIITAGED